MNMMLLGAGGASGSSEPPAPLTLIYDHSVAAGRVAGIAFSGAVVDVEVDWGDGTINTYSSTVDASHTHATDGPWTVTVTGTASRLGRAAVGNIISGLTLVSVTNFGEGLFNCTDFSGAFRNCINLTNVPANIPAAVTKCASMFRTCDAINSANVALWNTSNITDMNVMFGSATAFNQNLAGWDVSNVTIMTSAFFGTALSTANYDAILASWSAQSVKPSISVHFGAAKYTNQAARDILTSAPNNWSITDGGAV